MLKYCDMTDEAGIADPQKIFIATQRQGKHVSAAKNNHATTELINLECELVPVGPRRIVAAGRFLPAGVWARNRDSSVGAKTVYGLDGSGLIPGSARFLSSPQRLGPTQSPIQWVTEALSPGLKRQWRETDHSPPSSAEIKNGGSIPPHISSWHSA
jgi:hypothetical protein